MGVITLQNEYSVNVPPAKLFRAFCSETDTLLPKILPQHIKSSEIIEGNGGPGSIRKITFSEGLELTYVKQKIESINEASFEFCISLLESDNWKEQIEKVTYEFKFVTTPEGGSLCKRTTTYITKGDFQDKADQVKDTYGKKTDGLFKAVEAYFLANPDA